MDQSYTPISCSAHDVLESIATLREECSIRYRDEQDRETTVNGKIKDVYTSNGAEFVTLDNNQTIRLDQLVQVNDTVIEAARDV